MKKTFLTALTGIFALSLVSCSDDNNPAPSPTPSVSEGLFIVCNGNYTAGNGSVSYYNPETDVVENEVFQRANGMKLGDTAQSMSITGKTGWICVNGSNVIYAIDTDSYLVKGRVTGVTSPRNALAVNDNKVYVTMLYDNRIAIVNPKTYSVSGYVEIPEMEASTGSTEQMVKIGDFVYVNCWSYQKEVLKIDTRTDKVVDRLTVGIQPESLAYDGENLWVLCDGGGWEANPIGYEAPTLSLIDLGSFKVQRTVTLAKNSTVSRLNYYDGNLYWLENGVQRMSVNADAAPSSAFISSTSYSLYSLTINPVNGDIYVGDAIDYMQSGIVTRYNANGEKVSSFNVGVIPSGFCWKN